MADPVSISAVFRVTTDDRETLRALLGEIVDATVTELPRTLIYEWFLSEDGGTAYLYERFADADAMAAHEQVFGERYAGRLMSLVEPTSVTVLGDPGPKLREEMGGYGARFGDFLLGVVR